MKLLLFIIFAHLAFANKNQPPNTTAPKNTSLDVPVKVEANETET